MSHGTTLAWCHQTPNASTTKATWARVSVRKEPWQLRTTTTQILWSDGWACLAKRVGVLSIPMLKKPTRVTHQALLSDQGHCVVVVPGSNGSLRTETLPQDASVGKNIRVLTTPCWGECSKLLVKSSQVTFIYIALLTIQIVTKQLHNIKMGK